MTVITMSRAELGRLRVMIDLADGRTRVADAAALLGLQRRQVYRLLEAFRADGADALISRRRGRPSNRSHGEAFRRTCLALVRDRYADFGPALAAEKLLELHGVNGALSFPRTGEVKFPTSGEVKFPRALTGGEARRSRVAQRLAAHRCAGV